MSRVVFDSDEVGDIRVEGSSAHPDSRALITISNALGQHSVVVTPTQIIEVKSKDYVQAPPERVVPKNQYAKRQVATIISFAGYAMIAVLMSFVVLSTTGKIQARVVLTGSMAPTINSGDIVFLNPSKANIPQKDDIVTYTGRRFDGTAVGSFTHRITGGDADTGFILKGDANLNPDVQRVKPADIVGKVVFVLPYIGQFLTPAKLFTLIPFIFILWLMVDRFKNE
jgi:signal peptidase